MSLIDPVSFKLFAVGLFSTILPGGNRQGLFKIPNMTAFDYQPQTENDTIAGTELENGGQTLDAITDTDDLLVNITSNRFTGPSWALSSMGSEQEVAGGSTPVTNDLGFFLGNVAELSHMNIVSAGFAVVGKDITVDDTTGFAANTLLSRDDGTEIGVIFDVPDATSLHVFTTNPDAVLAAADVLTDGTNTCAYASEVAKNDGAALPTDFLIDGTYGKLTRVVGGALDLSTLKRITTNYNYTQFAGSEIWVGTNTVMKGELIVKALNRVNNKLFWVRVPRLSIAPNQAITLMGDDRSSVQWQGTAEKVASESASIIIRAQA